MESLNTEQKMSLEELDAIEFQLSEEDEQMLAEVSELSKNMPDNKDFLSDLFEAAKKGSMNYVDSFIDITEIGDYQKNPQSMRDNEEITIKYHDTRKKELKEDNHYRTLFDARYSPYSKDSVKNHSKMSEAGRATLKEYETEYRNRVKTVDKHTGSNNANTHESMVSLSGLESYRFGPKVSLYTPDEYLQKYNAAGCPNLKKENWIREKVNFPHFDNEVYKEFGFCSPEEFRNWREENKFIIHEGPDGMFLVPSDVHDLERHGGQKSQIQKYLKGDITKEEYEEWEKKAKRQRQIQELKVRGTRAINGAAKSSAIVLAKQLIVYLAQEIKVEFIDKKECIDKIVDRIKRIFTNWFQRIKDEWKTLLNMMKSNFVASIGMELMNAIVDFLLHSFKNVAKIIRVMLNSIIRALKIIFDQTRPWEERLFEALKILAAGMTAYIGIGLNEAIADFITTNFPPIAGMAPFIADALSGFISCILSSIVLCMFDSYKENLQIKSMQLRMDLLNTKMIYTSSSLALISSIKTGKTVIGTMVFTKQQITEIGDKRERIMGNQTKANISLDNTEDRVSQTSEKIKALSADDEEDIDL